MGNNEYMFYKSLFKGNYIKGANTLEGMILNQLQVEELASDSGAMSVILEPMNFGGRRLLPDIFFGSNFSVGLGIQTYARAFDSTFDSGNILSPLQTIYDVVNSISAMTIIETSRPAKIALTRSGVAFSVIAGNADAVQIVIESISWLELLSVETSARTTVVNSSVAVQKLNSTPASVNYVVTNYNWMISLLNSSAAVTALSDNQTFVNTIVSSSSYVSTAVSVSSILAASSIFMTALVEASTFITAYDNTTFRNNMLANTSNAVPKIANSQNAMNLILDGSNYTRLTAMWPNATVSNIFVTTATSLNNMINAASLDRITAYDTIFNNSNAAIAITNNSLSIARLLSQWGDGTQPNNIGYKAYNSTTMRNQMAGSKAFLIAGSNNATFLAETDVRYQGASSPINAFIQALWNSSLAVDLSVSAASFSTSWVNNRSGRVFLLAVWTSAAQANLQFRYALRDNSIVTGVTAPTTQPSSYNAAVSAGVIQRYLTNLERSLSTGTASNLAINYRFIPLT